MSLLVIGAMAVMFGIAASIVLPIVYLGVLGKHGRPLGDLATTIGLTSIYRPAFTVNDVGDLLIKKRSYNDELNVEEVGVGGITRELSDPQKRIHKWSGIPVGLVDELTGAVFDPRDADIGQRARDHFDNASLVHAHTSPNEGYVERMRAFFELSKGTRGVGLSSIRYLVGGGSDANAAERVIEHYRKSQSPRSKSTMLRQLMIPVGMFLLVVLVGWFAYNQTGGTSPAGGGSSETVGYLLLLASTPAFAERLQEKIQATPNRVLAVGGVSVVAVVGIQFVLLSMMPLLLLVAVNIAFLAGFLSIPGVAFVLGRNLGPVGVLLGKLYLVLGFLPYEEPVVMLTEDEEYQVREGSEVDFEVEPVWYRFAKTWLGFTYHNSLDMWPDGTVESAKNVKEYGRSVRADGGEDADRGLPYDYTTAESIQYAGHKGFVPTDPDEGDVFVRSHHSLAWYKDVCRGEIIRRAHQYAKEKYGDGEDGMDSKTVLFLTVVMMTFGLALDYLAFFS